MIEQNTHLFKEVHDGSIRYSIGFDWNNDELNRLYDKYDGRIHVRITKPVSKGSEEQNRAAHSLMAAYFETGLHSCPEPCTLDFFKIYLKVLYGPCYDFEHDGKSVNIPKSWSLFSKQERCDFITGLISEIHQSGAFVESEKIRQIISGMNDDKT